MIFFFRHGDQLIKAETMWLIGITAKVSMFRIHQELSVMRKVGVSGWILRLLINTDSHLGLKHLTMSQ